MNTHSNAMNTLIPTTTDMITRPVAQAAINELGWRLAKTAAGGRQWAKVARALGYTVMGEGGQVTLFIRFTPNDMEAYHRHSDNMRNLIGRCPVTDTGSTWGDDALAATANKEQGCIRLSTSGVSKRFVAGLR
jgi:hypothetical protein